MKPTERRRIRQETMRRVAQGQAGSRRPGKTWRSWTYPEIERMRFYAGEGLSVSRTARLLGRSAGSIAGMASKHGIVFNSSEDGAPIGNQNRRKKISNSI